MVFRAYDDGIAYRLVSHDKKPFRIMREQVEYRFAGDPVATVPMSTAARTATTTRSSTIRLRTNT